MMNQADFRKIGRRGKKLNPTHSETKESACIFLYFAIALCVNNLNASALRLVPARSFFTPPPRNFHMQPLKASSIVPDAKLVRWYILQLPAWNRNVDAELRTVRDRCLELNFPSFEYFAPTFREVRIVNGKMKGTDKPLFLNYVFIRSSQADIYRMMKELMLSRYSFLPMVRDKEGGHFPYLTDKSMENLKWVARSYDNEIPVYNPSPDRLMRGDRIRITEGQLAGMEATVVTTAGAAKGKVMVQIEDFMWVPLFEIRKGQYEVIELNKRGGHQYAKLSGTHIFKELDKFLELRVTGGIGQDDEDRLRQIVREYSKLKVETGVLRCKLCAILLMAYSSLNDLASKEQTIAEAMSLLRTVSSEMSRALLLVTLYGCTDNSIWYEKAHEMTMAWRREDRLKPAKAEILARLDFFDALLGHRPSSQTELDV